MSSVKPAPTPSGLKSDGRNLWREIITQVAEDGCKLDARELTWLRLACAEADQLARVEAQLADAELVVKGSMGQPVANSLLSEATRCRQVIAALLARLSLDDPMAAIGRGGRTTPTSARAAAMARRRMGVLDAQR
jgi:hypothetical protein